MEDGDAQHTCKGWVTVVGDKTGTQQSSFFLTLSRGLQPKFLDRPDYDDKLEVTRHRCYRGNSTAS